MDPSRAMSRSLTYVSGMRGSSGDEGDTALASTLSEPEEGSYDIRPWHAGRQAGGQCITMQLFDYACLTASSISSCALISCSWHFSSQRKAHSKSRRRCIGPCTAVAIWRSTALPAKANNRAIREQTPVFFRQPYLERVREHQVALRIIHEAQRAAWPYVCHRLWVQLILCPAALLLHEQ